MVLGGGAGHGRPANVDILDGGVKITAARHYGLEGIKIADQQVDAFNAMALHRRGVIGFVAQRQKPAMHHRMQCLDPAIHHFRKVGDVGNVADRQPRLTQRLGGAAGRDQHYAMRRQLAREINQPGLVRNRQQGAGNLAIGHGRDSAKARLRPALIASGHNIKGPKPCLHTANRSRGQPGADRPG